MVNGNNHQINSLKYDFIPVLRDKNPLKMFNVISKAGFKKFASVEWEKKKE